jgi:AraC-like DNA-binding protein
MPNRDTFSLPPRVLAELGPSLQRMCARAGLPLSNAWSTSEFFRLWEAAEHEFGDRAAGLRFGADGASQGRGVAAVVARHAPDLRHALAALGRYKRLTCPESVEVEIARGEASVRYRWLQATGAVPRLLVDTTLASLKELARRGSAGRIAPIRVELARRAADQALLREHFGCRIVFGAPHDALVFDAAALDLPFAAADEGAFARVLGELEAQLARGDGFPGLPGETRLAIARQLNEGRQASVAEVARRLNLSSRTLQRRLGECRTSFQEQLAGVRRTTASRLLANTELDTVAIAMLLGFAEPNSFERAFRSWERTTPARWRARQAGPAA